MSEFLVMAATLIKIKAKMLLPKEEEEEEELIVGEVEEGVNRNQVLIGDGDEGDDDFEFL